MMIKKLLLSAFLVFSISAIAATEGAVDLAPKFTEGKSYQYEMEGDISVLQKIPEAIGCDMRYKGNIKSRLHYKVNQVFEDQNAEIAVTLINPEVKFSMSCDTKDNPSSFIFQFDSTQKPENEVSELQEARTIIECLDQSTFVFKVSPTGKVLEASGIESFKKNMNEELSENDQASEGANQSLCSWIEPESTEILTSLITGFLPESPVNVGDSWESALDVGGFNITTTRQLVSADKNRIVINESTPLELNKNDQGMVHLEKFAGKEEAKLTLDAEDNWILSNESQAEFQTQQSLDAPFGEESAEVEMRMEAKFNFKRLDL